MSTDDFKKIFIIKFQQEKSEKIFKLRQFHASLHSIVKLFRMECKEVWSNLADTARKINEL